MLIRRFDVDNVRSIQHATLHPARGLNEFVGGNGAGKTSLLEALHVLAYGRSFRGRVRDGLVRSGQEALSIFCEWQEGDDATLRRAGLRHRGSAWEGRLDGEPVSHLGELCAAFMVVCFEPGSHALVSGGGEPRRRFMDWGLFHVEPGFLAAWRRYSRTLKQRNSLLKSGARREHLEAWDHELADAGEHLTTRRELYLARLHERIAPNLAGIAPMLGSVGMRFEAGWRRSEMALGDALLLAQERDRLMGHTTVGPHRADWRLSFAAAPNGEALSRGQAKLAALACLLAQAEDCAATRGGWPAIALDDLASELDPSHRERVLATLAGTGAQVFLTGTEPSGAADARLFHVEHGVITPG